MSTDGNTLGGKMLAGELVGEAKALIDDAAAEAEQMDLLEPLTAEETALAQEELGPMAGPMAVVRHARETRRRGRPAGSRNRRTDDFVAYLSQFGPDPAVALAKILAESEEAMIARSRQLDPHKRQLSFGDARAMRIRAAEALMPYHHSKKPVAVDATIRGVMVVEEIGHGHGHGGPVIIDHDPVGVLPFEGDD